jgi:hypothetical protein
MSRYERWLMDVANLMVGGTGIVYAVMKYLMESTDEWAVVNHPWQPHVQHLHVVAAPLLVFTCGLLWSNHVVPKLQAKGSRGRLTGLTLVAQLIPMVVSGYLIQVSVSEGWRTVWIWVHLVTSIVWLLTAITHRLPLSEPSRLEANRDADDGPDAGM